MNAKLKFHLIFSNRFFIYNILHPLILSIFIAEIECCVLYFHSKFSSPNIFYFIPFYFLIIFFFRIVFSSFITLFKKDLKKSYFLYNFDFITIIILFSLLYIDQKTSINIIKKNLDFFSISQLVIFVFLLFAIVFFIRKFIRNLSKKLIDIIFISLFLILIIIFFMNINNYSKINNSKQILLVSIDSLRPDHLSCYGYKKIQTKNIDELAKNSYVFMNAYCQAPYTVSSLASISTGCFPFHTNVRDFGMKINPNIKTLGEILLEYDYDCAMIEGPYFKYKNYSRGTRNIDISLLPFAEYVYYKTYNFINKKPIKARTICATSYIKNNIGKSYFLWIHYWDPHAPYQPPKAYINKKANSKINGSVKQLLDFMNGNLQFSKDDLNYLIKLYDSEILFIDDNLGILLKIFFKKNHNYIYIITADHGEALGERNLFLHANDLIEEMIKVPLMINCSWFTNNGRRVHKVVSSIDIIPTLLDFLQIKKFGSHFDGKSLIPLMKGKKQDYLEVSYFETNQAEKIGIRYKEYKMTYDVINKEKRIYNLKQSVQVKDISENPLISKKLENILLNLLNISCLEDLEIYKSEKNKKLKEELKALGYIK